MAKRRSFTKEIKVKIPEIGKVHVGVLQKTAKNRGMIVACHRKDAFPGITIDKHEILENYESGEVVVYTLRNGIEILECLGSIKDPHVFAPMAIHAREIPYMFSDEALEEADDGIVPPVNTNRQDLRDIPFITIDGADAKDFDDAVAAFPDRSPTNPNGWRVFVAIADVSYYVLPDSALDREAKERGNSVYFPDCVVPMLPEALSNDLCSLRPLVERASLAVEMIITNKGKLKTFKFKRGLIKSHARTTYTQIQTAIDNDFEILPDLVEKEWIKNLYGSYLALRKARTMRGSLELDLPEYRIQFNDDDEIEGVKAEYGQESNKLIEEFMVLANVCAAKALAAKDQPTILRVHEHPDEIRFQNLLAVLQSVGIALPKKKTATPFFFNDVLKKASGKPQEKLINDLVLRCQAQAKYAVNNLGHFGLGLAHYAHFTSPIRRYADLIVHRCLITKLNLGNQYDLPNVATMFDVADYITTTEKRASKAEREVRERMIAQILEEKVGEKFVGSISGVTAAGLFVHLNGYGTEGFLSVKDLPGDYFIYDDRHQRLMGRRSKKSFQLGQEMIVVLVAANSMTSTVQLVPEGYDLNNSPEAKPKFSKTKPFEKTANREKRGPKKASREKRRLKRK